MSAQIRNAKIALGVPDVELSRSVSKIVGGITIFIVIAVLIFAVVSFFTRKFLFDYWKPVPPPKTVTNPKYPNGAPPPGATVGKLGASEKLPDGIQAIFGANLGAYERGGFDSGAWNAV